MPSVELVAGNPIVVPAREVGTATYTAGDLVQFDTSGYIALGSAASYCAIARKTGSTTAGTECEIEMVNPYNVYRMKGVAGTSIAWTDIGVGFAITFTSGGQYITVGTATDGYVVSLEDPIGTSGGLYLVQFLDTAIATGLIG